MFGIKFPWTKSATFIKQNKHHRQITKIAPAPTLTPNHMYGFPDEKLAYAYVEIRSDVEVLMSYVESQVRMQRQQNKHSS